MHRRLWILVTYALLESAFAAPLAFDVEDELPHRESTPEILDLEQQLKKQAGEDKKFMPKEANPLPQIDGLADDETKEQQTAALASMIKSQKDSEKPNTEQGDVKSVADEANESTEPAEDTPVEPEDQQAELKELLAEAEDTPVEPEDQQTELKEMLAEAENAPAESDDAQAEADDVPAELNDAPVMSEHDQAELKEVSAESNDAPAEPEEAAAEADNAPAENEGTLTEPEDSIVEPQPDALYPVQEELTDPQVNEVAGGDDEDVAGPITNYEDTFYENLIKSVKTNPSAWERLLKEHQRLLDEEKAYQQQMDLPNEADSYPEMSDGQSPIDIQRAYVMQQLKQQQQQQQLQQLQQQQQQQQLKQRPWFYPEVSKPMNGPEPKEPDARQLGAPQEDWQYYMGDTLAREVAKKRGFAPPAYDEAQDQEEFEPEDRQQRSFVMM